VYRAACESKTPWDAKLDDKLTQRWKKWERITPKIETTPRAIVDHREPVDELELHAFGDASTQGVGAAVYSIVRQKSGVTQRLVAGKGRLTKQGLTIPRLELVAAHMATNLVMNVEFNLSRAPWWSGQFERLIGIVKKAMHKTIGGVTLTWQELSEVMLDIQTQINRRPLSYVEDDAELPTLTPSTFLFQRSNQLPEQEPWREGEKSLRKRAKFLITCKKNLWNCWRRECLTALRVLERDTT
jgi:hypothetical protein